MSTRNNRHQLLRSVSAGALFIALVGVVLPAPVAAQASQATISGIVTDPSGGVIPGVSVAAINLSTGQRTTVTTNDQGFFVLTQLPIGHYAVEAEITGFRKYVRPSLTVTTAATMALDVHLEVGNVDNVVTVTDEAPLLQTRTSDIGQLLES
jgi:hypothetical protein